MVYLKENGSHGFSYQQQYDFLLAGHPDCLEEIVHTKFMVLKEQEPENAAHYEQLDTELTERLDTADDSNSTFGYSESDDIVKTFIREKGLTELFRDVPAITDQTNSDETLAIFDLDDDDGTLFLV